MCVYLCSCLFVYICVCSCGWVSVYGCVLLVKFKLWSYVDQTGADDEAEEVEVVHEGVHARLQ